MINKFEHSETHKVVLNAQTYLEDNCNCVRCNFQYLFQRALLFLK